MIIARVIGNVVATRKHPQYAGLKMMLVRAVDLQGRDAGDDFLAADAVGSGAGETVLVVTDGRAACDAIRLKEAPLDAAIVAIVDHVDLEPSAGAGRA